MKKHTLQFKNKIKEFGRQLDSKITYELNGETIELGNEKLNSITPTFQSKILKSAMKQLDIDSNEDIPLNTKINYKFGTLIDNEYEYINYGNYIVYSSEKQEDTDSYKIICYDKMLYSMVNYEGLRNGSFPMTVKEFIKNICKDLYLDFKDSNFANQDKLIEIDLYKDLGYTYRDVLDELSEVTASTICMNDNDELEVRYIEYASYDKEVTGETITINDNELDKAKSLIISGNLEQKTYSGKNLLNGKDLATQTINGITFTPVYENGLLQYINMNGTATAQIGYSISISQLAIGRYVLTDGTTDSYDTTFFVYITDSTGYINQTSRGTVTFNKANDSNLNAYIRVRNGITLNNKKIYPMISISSGEYEPYVGGIPSPNPDYPQEIDVVEGVRNLFNKENNYKINGYLSTSVIASDNNNRITYQKCDKNKTYTISRKVGTRFSVAYTKTLPTENTQIFGKIQNNTASSLTITTGNDAEYLVIWYYISSDTLTEQEIYNSIQIEEGNIVHYYVPYGSNYLINKITGKNLFDKNNYTNGFLNINTGVIDSTSSWVSSWAITDFIKVNDKNITLSFKYLPTTTSNAWNIKFGYYDINKNYISGVQEQIPFTQENGKTYSLPNNAKYIRFNYVVVDYINEAQIEEGTQETEYDPYKETIIKYDLQNNYLAKIRDNIDTLDEVSGVLNRKIGKLVLNGTETGWGIKSNREFYNTTYSNIFKSLSKCVSTHFIYSSTVWTLGGFIGITATKNLWITTTQDFTLPQFINWLSNNPVTLYFELETPETIQLTPTQIPLFEGTNNLSLESNMSTKMTLKYTNEIDTIDEEYLKDVNVNFGEKYGPINSIVLSRAAESDNVYIQDEESIQENGLHELKIVDNQIMNFNDRSDYLPELLERLDGLEYYLNDFSSTGICYYDICDKYRIKVFDNTYECVMFNDEVNITQGLEENVYTEMPEETETDYTKADKTDQRINQTYLIVDKQNQKIESLASQVIDLTREKNGIRYLEINDAYPSDIITLKIKGKINSTSNLKLIVGTKLPRGELYPSNDLYPSNSLHFDYDGTLVKLPISQLNEDETLIIENNDCYIEKDDGTITHYGEVHIPLNENDNYIYLQDFYNSPIDYYGKYAIKSEYTTVFTTKLEMSSSIEQTASEINLEVRKKVDTGDVISTINQSAEQITLKSNRLVVESDNFKLDGEGNMECSNAKINGDINLNSKNEIKIFNEKGELVTEYNYNGATFYRNDNKIGTIGTSVMNSGAKKGLSFLLDGDYMSWAFKNNQGTYDTKLRYDSSNNQLILTNRLGSTGDAIVNYGGGGNAVVAFDCTESGLFYTDGNRVSHMIPVSSSDYRLKENIKNTKITALDLINKIKHKEFNWKKSGNKQNIGYIAQELEEILEDYVNKVPQKDENNNIIDYLYEVNMLPLLATATKAIQEQQNIINNMQNQIDELKEMVNSGIH